jgi:hypothetical protein
MTISSIDIATVWCCVFVCCFLMCIEDACGEFNRYKGFPFRAQGQNFAKSMWEIGSWGHFCWMACVVGRGGLVVVVDGGCVDQTFPDAHLMMLDLTASAIRSRWVKNGLINQRAKWFLKSDQFR